MNIRYLICLGALLAMSTGGIPAYAISARSEPHAEGTAVPPRVLQRAANERPRSGIITEIDLGRHIIVIGGVTYMFTPVLTRVHSADPAINGNPLKLAPGQTVRFRVIDQPGQRPRVVEIFL